MVDFPLPVSPTKAIVSSDFWGQLNNHVMLSLLSRASQPRTLADDSEEEAHFMTSKEARSLLELSATLYGLIITKG
jgi:hypothetical protein